MEELSIEDVIKNLQSEQEKGAFVGKLPFSKIGYTLKKPSGKHITKINSTFMSTNQINTGITFNKLVKELLDDLLILDGGKTYKAFNIYDYHYLIFKIREHISDDISMYDEEGKVIGKYNIKERLEEFSKVKPKTLEVGSDTCKVTLHPPSLFRINKFDDELEKKNKELSKQKEPDIEKYANDILKNTIGRFVQKLVMVVNNSEMLFDFHKQIRVSDQIKVLDNLPKGVFGDVSGAIDSMFEPISDLLSYDEDNSIQLDETFFVETKD